MRLKADGHQLKATGSPLRYGVYVGRKFGIKTALEPTVLAQGVEAVAAETRPLEAMIFCTH